MRAVLGPPNLQNVPMRLKADPDRQVRVLIVGAGVAGCKASVDLRELAGDRVEIELICPEPTFEWRGVAVAAGFDQDRAPSVHISQLADSIGARYTRDTLAGVHSSGEMVTLASGATRRYDILLAGLGARVQEAIPGAITFGTPRGIQRFRQLIGQAEARALSRLVFAVPGGASWLPALYELALLTAARLRAVGASVQITLLSHEPSPVAVLGQDASDAMVDKLEDHGIKFVAGLHSEEIAWGELRASPGQVRIRADGVITVPRLLGRSIPGLRSDQHGFISADANGLVPGTANLYAAGDVVASPTKHDALVRQQSVAAVAAIVGRLGALPTAPSASHPAPLEADLDPERVGSALAGG